MPIATVSFEIYGKVQGVFFRKCTLAKALELHLKGWVQNEKNPEKTVVGVAQGEKDAVDKFKIWISTEGSPSSKITDCKFFDEKEIKDLDFSNFEIRK